MTFSQKIRALVVDDEPVARDRVVRLLQQQSDIELVGQCSNGLETVTAIERLSPDLVFLDVQMPEMDGFEVVKALDARHVPAVVFVTAYDEYALRAFEVHALDYLLKPFSSMRFRATLAHARDQLHRRRAGWPRRYGNGRKARTSLITLTRLTGRTATGPNVSSSDRQGVCTSSAPPRLNGAKPPGTTCGSMSDGNRICFAKR